MSKMNERVKKLWVDALRSGDYEQGRERLRDSNNNFCCFGVLCNLHAIEHPEIAAQESRSTSYMGGIYFPPAEVLEWAGLRDKNPFVGSVTIAYLNDVRKKDFNFIADMIEEHL